MTTRSCWRCWPGSSKRPATRSWPAAKGKPALDLAKDQKPKLAIVDLLLPDMMGYQLADALRTALGDIPFVFITGVFKGPKHAGEAAQRHKAAGFFEKPFDAKKLLETVKKLVPPDAPSPLTSAVQNAADEFEVELDIDVEEDIPQEEMELTGRIRVTGGGNISAELRGEALHASGGSMGPVSGRGRPHPPAGPREGAQAGAAASAPACWATTCPGW